MHSNHALYSLMTDSLTAIGRVPSRIPMGALGPVTQPGRHVKAASPRSAEVRFADVAGLVSDAVGVYCFTPVSPSRPTTYKALTVPSHIQLDRVLFRASQVLAALR